MPLAFLAQHLPLPPGPLDTEEVFQARIKPARMVRPPQLRRLLKVLLLLDLSFLVTRTRLLLSVLYLGRLLLAARTRIL